MTKRYGDKVAADDLSFTVQPGVVTGFLGPNGAGKSTTMRLILGLDAPTGGTITVNGGRFAEHTHPLREVGALLEARGVHPGRSARNHLLALAATAGIGAARVDEVIDMVGLSDVASKRVRAFSDNPTTVRSHRQASIKCSQSGQRTAQRDNLCRWLRTCREHVLVSIQGNNTLILVSVTRCVPYRYRRLYDFAIGGAWL